MARKSSRSTTQRRDTPRIANSRVFRTQPELPFGLPLNLSSVEDRRAFHPMGELRPAKNLRGASHQLVVRNAAPAHAVRNPYFVNRGVAFQAPRDVLVCIRRENRREVLHALNKTGKVGQKKPRYSHYSSISCKGK